MNIYLVGGAVRDGLMGKQPKDVDFAVESTYNRGEDAFMVLHNHLEDWGFDIYQSKPEFLTIKAKFPAKRVTRDHQWWDSYVAAGHKTADFVICRKDGPSADGRRPDFVETGTIYDDLARRDFTMNAIAKNVTTGGVIDPHNGTADIANKVIRFVGDPMTRIREDGLRVMRAWRFWATMDFSFDLDTGQAIREYQAGEMLRKVSVERVYEELKKISDADKIETFMFNAPGIIKQAIFRAGLKLVPSLKKG